MVEVCKSSVLLQLLVSPAPPLCWWAKLCIMLMYPAPAFCWWAQLHLGLWGFPVYYAMPQSRHDFFPSTPWNYASIINLRTQALPLVSTHWSLHSIRGGPGPGRCPTTIAGEPSSLYSILCVWLIVVCVWSRRGHLVLNHLCMTCLSALHK